MIGFISESDKKEDIFPHYELKDGEDMAVFGEDIAFPARMDNNNGNTIVLGSTGSGKTKSVVEPKILYSFDQSLVIPVAKRRLVKQYTPLLESRGYEVIDLNLAKPKDSIYGYDPMRTAKTEDELLNLATSIIGANSRTMQGESDPFWQESSAAACAAILGLSRYINGPDSGFLEFMKLFRSLEITYPNGHLRSNLDEDFDEMAFHLPDSQTPRLWRTVAGCASRTASCINSILNNALSRFCGEYGDTLFSKKKMVDLSMIGRKKMCLFITTSNISEPCSRIVNLFFADLFKELFEESQKDGGRLKVPVHVCCDDFCGAGAKISRFEEYITIFREAGVSCTILLQSLSMLNAVYHDYGSAVIRENCDNMVYLGSNDLRTCKEISERAAIPLENVLNMQPGDEVFIRRGVGSAMVKRYKILEDPAYISTLDNLEK